MKTQAVMLDGAGLAPPAVEDVAVHRAAVALDEGALAVVQRNRRALDEAIRSGAEIYGVTTGLGALVRQRISPDDAGDGQQAVLRSHAAGVGPPLPREVVRAALVVRLNGLLLGHSGIRPLVLDRLARLLNADLVPYVPRTGSLGASGDLAPSAHAFLPLIGEGWFLGPGHQRLPAHEVLAAHGLAPLELAPKEALALINGTHVMGGIGALLVQRAARLLDTADAAAALTLEALRGACAAFEERVHALRPLPGQSHTAATIRRLVNGSQLVGSRPGVQDAYSLRCVPQVHGAAREAVAFFARMVAVDLNAVTDNPVVFTDPPDVVSAGNFHGQSLALGFDVLRLALADLATIAERRVFRVLSPSLNGDLPPFLTPHAGRASGYMVAQYTAAALVSELRILAQPASIDSIPTSDNQEDHVSMGMTAALLSLDAVDRLTTVLAIEALCAAQAIDLTGDQPGDGTARLHAAIRQRVPPLDEDRPPADDIAALTALVAEGALAAIR